MVALPHLSRLQLQIWEYGGCFDLERRVAVHVKYALDKVKLTGLFKPTILSRFLECLSSITTVDSLHFDLSAEETWDAFQTFTGWQASIMEYVRRFGDSPRRFHLRLRILEGSPSDTLEGRLLEPLYQLCYLEKIELYIYHACLVLDDADIESMASSWPAAQEVTLIGDPCSSPGPTLSSLRSFACHCPRLQKLSLYFDTKSTIQSFEDVRPHGLKVLEPRKHIEVSDVKPVASFLQGVFPSARIYRPMLKKWSLVQTRLDTLAADANASH